MCLLLPSRVKVKYVIIKMCNLEDGETRRVGGGWVEVALKQCASSDQVHTEE